MADAAAVVEKKDSEVVKRLIAEMPDEGKRALKGWYFYDWANQAYALTVMTVIAPQLMASLYNLATGTQSGDTFYAYVLTFSMLFVVITAPALGVIAGVIKKNSPKTKLMSLSDNILPHEKTPLGDFLTTYLFQKLDGHIVQSSQTEKELQEVVTLF